MIPGLKTMKSNHWSKYNTTKHINHILLLSVSTQHAFMCTSGHGGYDLGFPTTADMHHWFDVEA